MSTSDVYLHYFNANVEGRLPHTLEFKNIYGRLVTDQEISGQVVTVVSFGSPRRYFVWSTFEASLRVQEYRGKTVVQGTGWHLCPPYEISEKYVAYLAEDNLRDHLFIPVIDQGIAEWLLAIVHRYKPPGNPNKLKIFLKQLWRDVGNEEIERKVAKLFKAIKV